MYSTSELDEVKRAREAAESAKQNPAAPTIFSKILDKSIPADILHEDEHVSPDESVLLYIYFDPFLTHNWEPAVLVHYVALIGNLSIV